MRVHVRESRFYVLTQSSGSGSRVSSLLQTNPPKTVSTYSCIVFTGLEPYVDSFFNLLSGHAVANGYQTNSCRFYAIWLSFL